MKPDCNYSAGSKSNRGATSVLVVFMMIVLVTFGAFSISAANVNIRLAKKAINWNATFYELDGLGESLLADLDYVLADAEAFAVDYLRQEAYALESYPLISEELQLELHGMYKAGGADNTFLNTVLNHVYFYQAVQKLDKLQTRRDLLTNLNEAVSYTVFEGEEGEELYIYASLTSGVNSDFHLDIELTLNQARYIFTTLNDEIQGSRYPSSTRFRISKWKQWQNQTDPNGGMKLWDGVVR